MRLIYKILKAKIIIRNKILLYKKRYEYENLLADSILYLSKYKDKKNNIIKRLYYLDKYYGNIRLIKKYNRKIKRKQRKRERFFKNIRLEVYFGCPGSGKSTLGAIFAKKAIKLGVKVYSNYAIKGAYKIEPKEDLGKYLIEECLLIIDEAGLEHSNRDFKSFTKENRYFYKMHRHYKCKVIIFSQADDMDLVIRNLAYKYYLVKKSLIPYFILTKGIHKYIGIDNITHEIKSMYAFDFFLLNKRYFAPSGWKLFDTYEAEKLAKKVFEKW